MGEGENSHDSRQEMIEYVRMVHDRGYKSCLYSGRDKDIEEWMKIFDYIKLGRYSAKHGPLYCRTTNQRMWKHVSCGKYKDITGIFWI